MFSNRTLLPTLLIYGSSEAAELKLADLVKGSMLKVGDMLAYRRNFTNLSRTVEKDVLVRHALTLPAFSV